MKKLLSLILVSVMIVAASSTTTFAAPHSDSDRELAQTADGMLNIVIDGGTALNEASAGTTAKVQIRLINNTAISSLKMTLTFDKSLTVQTNASNKPKVTYNIVDPEDSSVQKSSVYNQETNILILNWLSAESEVKGDTVYATVTVDISADVAAGSFLPITAQINPNDVFDIDQKNIEFNLINGGIDIVEHTPGEIEFDETNHWHSCTKCGEILDSEPHTFESELTDKPTCKTPGKITKKCTVCGYTEYETVEPINHSIGKVELKETVDDMLNIVIDGGTTTVSADPGTETDVNISLVNNVSISSIKIELKYDEDLTVVTNSKGKPVVTFGIDDPDLSPMKDVRLDEENRVLYINWVLTESELKGDTVFATVKFKVSENAAAGKFMPITCEYNQKNIFDIDMKEIPVNLINGGVYAVCSPDGYVCDGNSHWHICALCGEVFGVEAHADEDKDGCCDVCGYQMAIPGDTTGDGELDNKDVVTLFRFVSSGSKDDMIIFKAFDFNNDNEIDNKDVVSLFRALSANK